MEVYNLKSKKTLILFFALAMVATACSSAAVPCDEVEITTGENGLPDLDGCEFTFAVENAYLPFNYIDAETGEAMGWDYDVFNYMGELMNFTPVYVPTAWDGMIQATADVAGAGFRKNRAAGENIIPSVTNSSKVIESALPMLKDKIASFSMTVPVPDGSTIDLTLNLKTKTSKDEVNTYLEKVTADNSLKNIIGFTYDPIVSSDVVGNSLSGLIDGLSTMCIDEDKLKLIIWFDNGWGYASRIIEAVKSSEVQFE